MALQLIRALALLFTQIGPLIPGMARADVAPLISMAATPLFAGASTTVSDPSGAASGSLFSGTNAGYFAPLPPRAREDPTIAQPLGGGSPVAQLLSLIAQVEAGVAGYDAVQHGARIRPSRPPTQMTLGDIYAWIDATPRQPHAIGRYQFIPPTLRRVAQIRDFGPEVQFTPDVQDALALVLLEDAGLRRFEAGELPRRQFMHNLARIWAGLPLPNGRSYYEGYAGNSAHMSWDTFERGVEQIWPLG